MGSFALINTVCVQGGSYNICHVFRQILERALYLNIEKEEETWFARVQYFASIIRFIDIMKAYAGVKVYFSQMKLSQYINPQNPPIWMRRQYQEQYMYFRKGYALFTTFTEFISSHQCLLLVFLFDADLSVQLSQCALIANFRKLSPQASGVDTSNSSYCGSNGFSRETCPFILPCLTIATELHPVLARRDPVQLLQSGLARLDFRILSRTCFSICNDIIVDHDHGDISRW